MIYFLFWLFNNLHYNYGSWLLSLTPTFKRKTNHAPKMLTKRLINYKTTYSRNKATDINVT